MDVGLHKYWRLGMGMTARKTGLVPLLYKEQSTMQYHLRTITY